MLRTRKKDKYVLFITLKFIGIFIFCVGCLLLTEVFTANLKKDTLNRFINEQKNYTYDSAEKMSGLSSTSEILEYVKSLKSDGSHVWILFKNKELMYENDDIYSSDNGSSGITYDSLGEMYIRNGAEAETVTDFLTKVNKKQDFSTLMIRDSSVGNELITFSFVDINGENYGLGYGVSEKYILSVSNIEKNLMIIKIFIYLLVCCIAVACGYIIIIKYRNNIKIKALSSELVSKNLFIKDKIENHIIGNSFNISKTENETGLYTFDFFNLVVRKLIKYNIKDIGIVLIKIYNEDEYLFNKNISFTVNVIKKLNDKYRLAVRRDTSTIMLVSFGSTSKSVNDLSKDVFTVLSVNESCKVIGECIKDADNIKETIEKLNTEVSK